MKKTLFAGIGVTAAAVAVLIGLLLWVTSGVGSAYYYTQIENAKLEEVDSRGGVIDFQGGMPYSYTLTAYDENGGEKEMTFGASRELREGAFLRLTVMPVRGVVEWSEAAYDELPAAVQGNYAPVAEDARKRTQKPIY